MSAPVQRTIEIVDRHGPEAFASTLSVQTNLLDAKISDRDMADVIVFVEHEPVYTVGRGTPYQLITEGIGAGVPWQEIARGGKATYHGPGQLVVYPIFDLERHGKDVHVYLRKLEQAGIECLAAFGVTATTREGLTGIWTETPTSGWRKIASIGVGIKKWISYHGMAINVSTDLSYFRAIDACGASGSAVTSLAELLDAPPSLETVKKEFLAAVCRVFDLQIGVQPDDDLVELPQSVKRRARPSWLKVKAPGSPDFMKTQDIVKSHGLVTVCEEARCPNIGECWTHSSATFMIMGDLCTRRCSFCSVKDGTLTDLQPLDALEPVRCAQAVQKLGLKHVVITSVNRDDLPDMGALHFHRVVRAINQLNPECDIELLIPDMRGKRELVETILQSSIVKVLNHNVETVPSLYREVRPGASFKRSLSILSWAKEIQPSVRTKSGVMVGLGEAKEEVFEVMDGLRSAGVQVMTIGQYLQPSKKQLPVKRFVTPEEFAMYKEEGLKRGFLHVESGPLVRSSYHAWQHVGEQAATTPSPTVIAA